MNRFTQTIEVSPELTAEHIGSGSLPVYATPALIALMENTATRAIDTLAPGETSVGIAIAAQHLKASAVGEQITCTAQITAIDGRKISFDISATNEAEETIGTATHDRFVVNAEKFMSRLTNR